MISAIFSLLCCALLWGQISTYASPSLPIPPTENMEDQELPEDIGNIEAVNSNIFPDTPEQQAVSSNELTKPGNLIDFPTVPTPSNSISPVGEYQNSKARSAVSITQSFAINLEAQGEIQYISVRLAPYEYLQATLQCPKRADIDYDLYVFELTNFGLGTFYAGSDMKTHLNEYPDGSFATVDESCSFVYTGGTMKTFAVCVVASVGGDASAESILTVSVDSFSSVGAEEPNDFIGNAVEVKNNVVVGNDGSINFNVSNDVDWYALYNNGEYRSVQIETIAQAASIDVYTTTSERELILSSQESGKYSLSDGWNYIRIESLASSDMYDDVKVYQLRITPYENRPSEMIVVWDGDQGANWWPAYPTGQFWGVKDEFKPHIFLLSDSGYACPNYEVKCSFTSGSWSPSAPSYSASFITYVDENGYANPTWRLPGAMPANTYYTVAGTSHYYSVDEIEIYVPGTTLTESRTINHLSHTAYGP